MTALGTDIPAPTADEAFGRAVHMAMYDRHMTQERLAAVLGIAQGSVSRKLREVRPWSLTEMIATADTLRLDLRDLLADMWAPKGPANFETANQPGNVNFGWSTQQPNGCSNVIPIRRAA